jgi:hypothetical protein
MSNNGEGVILRSELPDQSRHRLALSVAQKNINGCDLE